MSFYSLFCPPSPLSPLLLKILGLGTEKQLPRFRDSHIHLAKAPAVSEILIYTRTGGGNREGFAAENKMLAGRFGYIRDEDCQFDSTFACFRYRIPGLYKARVERLQQILGAFPDFKSPEEKFTAMQRELQNVNKGERPDKPDARAMAELNKILKSIDADLEAKT